MSSRSTFWGTIQVGIVCAAVVVVVYILTSRPAPARRLWQPAVIEKNGSLTVLGETRQMNFWTPSVQTKDYLDKSNSSPNNPDRWQILASNDPVMQFGLLLHSNSGVLGYRRIEDWGHGRSVFKPGWWWTVNALTNLSPVEMGHIYQDFWKCSSPVFIEVVESRGSEP